MYDDISDELLTCTQKWSPLNINDGLGGSETACISLCLHWIKQLRSEQGISDASVTVYLRLDNKQSSTHSNSSSLPDDSISSTQFNELEHEGVLFRDCELFDMEEEIDTLIVWRKLKYLDLPFKARKIYLDLHDVPIASEFTLERLLTVDRIFVKSEYQRSFLPNVHDSKFVIIPNVSAEYMIAIV